MVDCNSHKTSNSPPFGMVMPGRNWKATTAEGYGFGFNGKLKDDDIMGNSNSYDFGSRCYDARLGKWFSVDIKTSSFPASSPYSFCLNNPNILTDKEGKEPTRLLSGSIEDALAHFRDKGLTTVDEIIEYIDYATQAAVNHYDEVPGMDDDVEGFVRYVYTEEKGWIDLYHYFNAAATSEEVMDLNEAVQTAQGKKSAYSYEDLPSNDLGGKAELEDSEGDELVGDELFDAVAVQFYEVESTEPENAPNWELIPAERSRQDPPKNLTDEEIDYEKFPAAEDSLQKQTNGQN